MNRRSFVQKIGLLGSGMFISLQTYPFSLLAQNEVIRGKVTDGKRGIAGVAISDGYAVVQTDKKGRYTLTPDARAKSVWLSTPAGYEFITTQNIARHYHTIGTGISYDFNLTKLKQDDTAHQFIIWADPQVKNKKDVQQMLMTTVPDVQQTLKTMPEDRLVHAICVGDIVWDNHALFDDYNQAVSEMGIPFFQALGNHDMDYRQGGDETSDVTFKKIYGPTYYSFNRGEAHYVVLENVRYLGTDRNYDGYMTSDQLEWLAKDLSYIPKDQLLIINLHIPMHNGVKNSKEFYAVLEGFSNVHIMSGHTHINQNVIANGVYEHNHGAVCGAWWTGPVCEDGTPRGYAVYAVQGKELKWYYKSTGIERGHQSKIYTEKLGDKTKMIVNIYNWDPAWKVAYLLDGKPMGELTNEHSFDPLATTLYKGDTLPAGRTFPEPRLTDHLFSVNFDTASVKQVSIVATDRFGEEFINEYTL